MLLATWYPTTTSQTRRREPFLTYIHTHTHTNPEEGQVGMTEAETQATTQTSLQYSLQIREGGNTGNENISKKKTRHGSDGIRSERLSPSRSCTCTNTARRRPRAYFATRMDPVPASGSRQPLHPPTMPLVGSVCAGDTKPFECLCCCFTSDGKEGDGRKKYPLASGVRAFASVCICRLSLHGLPEWG